MSVTRAAAAASVFATLVAPGGSSLGADAHAGMSALVPGPAAVKWGPAPPTLPKGTQLAVLFGDPAQPGPFGLRVKFQPNSVVPPHWHATDENLTVIEGSVVHQMGDKIDKAKGEEVAAGGFVYLPAKMNHSVWTTTAEAVVQVTGTGPFGINYVNPADDPSKSQ